MSSHTKIISSTPTITGAIALFTSIIYTSPILTFICLGLLFWGIILAYVRTEEYVKKALLDATVASQVATLNEIIQDMECEGNALYLPPKYFTDPEVNKVYIPKQRGAILPIPEQTHKQDPKFLIEVVEEPQGLILTPAGAP
jgi:hypothetical protein